jgi:hypothetical protein
MVSFESDVKSPLAAHYIFTIRGAGSLAVQVHDMTRIGINLQEIAQHVKQMRIAFQRCRTICIALVGPTEGSRQNFMGLQELFVFYIRGDRPSLMRS